MRVLEKGRDVVEENAGLREVGDLSDQLLEVVHGRSLLLDSGYGVKTRVASGLDGDLFDAVNAPDAGSADQFVATRVNGGGMAADTT
jgi:hypothetical protein